MSSDVEKLKAARELIARPGGWTQNKEARDSTGNAVEVTSEDAVCFCAYGAMWAAGIPLPPKWGRSYGADLYFEEAIGTPAIGSWNDNPFRTQAEVVDAFDLAIALAESAHV